MKKILIYILSFGLLLGTNACTNRDDQVPSAADRTFVQEAFQRNQMDMQIGQIVRTRGSFENLRRFAETTLRRGSQTADELQSLASERNIPVVIELSSLMQQEVNAIINTPDATFDSQYLTTVIASRQKTVDLYQKQIKDGKDNALREWAQGKVSGLYTELENARTLMEAIK